MDFQLAVAVAHPLRDVRRKHLVQRYGTNSLNRVRLATLRAASTLGLLIVIGLPVDELVVEILKSSFLICSLPRQNPLAGHALEIPA
jgi:hypothetical protein